MRHLILILPLVLIPSCRAHKDLQTLKTLSADSIARSEHRHSIIEFDSLIRNIDFTFDTLKINIKRPTENYEHPEIIRLTATNGRITNSQTRLHNHAENQTQLDTLSVKQSSSQAATELSSTTTLYNPPNLTALALFALLLAATLIAIKKL